MKRLTDIFREDLRTRDDITRVAQTVAIKQRDAKRVAIDYVIDTWERFIRISEQHKAVYAVMDGIRCEKCGGVILQQVHLFSTLTCGGNMVIGCPACHTISSGKMLRERKDIVLGGAEHGSR